MSTIEYFQLYSDTDGCSHFKPATMDLKTNDYAPPAIPLNTSSLAPAEASIFLELPVGWYGDWHPTPVRQWLIEMSGECEFVVGDGERSRRRAGDVVMLDDITGKGHCTRVIGDVPVRMAAIHFG
jgi:oxalate decarboxylase/phosphoglucose isomerase-like protein (cupin superfamily)